MNSGISLSLTWLRTCAAGTCGTNSTKSNGEIAKEYGRLQKNGDMAPFDLVCSKMYYFECFDYS